MARSHTPRGLDRLVNFTDAAVAIAITLLVLPLIDLVTDDQSRSLRDMFSEDEATFIAFAISFVVIASFWTGHHRAFEHLQDYTPLILWANFLWLASIVFIPFTTQLLADVGTDDPATNALYIGTMVVTTASLALIEGIAIRSSELQRAEVRGELELRDTLIAITLLVVALVLSVLAPAVGMYWLFLMFLSGPISTVAQSRRRAAPRHGGSGPEQSADGGTQA